MPEVANTIFLEPTDESSLSQVASGCPPTADAMIVKLGTKYITLTILSPIVMVCML